MDLSSRVENSNCQKKNNSNFNCKKIEILFVFYVIEWPTPSTATPSNVQTFLMLQNFMEATIIDINKL